MDTFSGQVTRQSSISKLLQSPSFSTSELKPFSSTIPSHRMSAFNVGTTTVQLRPTQRLQGPPAESKTIELPVGHKKRPGCRAFTTPTFFESNQTLVLRDGTNLRADIFRPKTEEKVPGIVMWGPYGKGNSGMLTLDAMPLRAGVPEDSQSGCESFEG